MYICIVAIALVSQAPPSIGAVDLRCGAYCLYVSLKSLDLPVGSYAELEGRLGQPTNLGYSMAQLQSAAESYGAHVLGVETTLAELERRTDRFACIALLDKAGHFVNIYDLDQVQVSIVDPPHERIAPRDSFGQLWSGKALLISDRPISPLGPRWDRIVWGVVLVLIVLALLVYSSIRLRARSNA